MMRYFINIWILGGILVLVSIFLSCPQKVDSLDMKESKEITEIFLGLMKHKKYEKLTFFYSEDFFSKVTAKEWEEDLDELRTFNGPIKGWYLVETKTEQKWGSPDEVMLIYNVLYTRGSTVQTFVLKKVADKFKIVTHNIKL